MMKYKNILFILLTCTAVQSCTTIVDATTSEPIRPDPSERSFGTYIDDKSIQITIGVNIRKANQELKEANIDIDSYNGVVLLTGQVPNNELRLQAAQIASQVPAVRQVHNELQIGDEIAFLEKTNDTWLATKIKASVLSSDKVKDLHLKTVVEDGVVYLMGKVTPMKADEIVSVVKNIRGVKEVVKVFEYI